MHSLAQFLHPCKHFLYQPRLHIIGSMPCADLCKHGQSWQLHLHGGNCLEDLWAQTDQNIAKIIQTHPDPGKSEKEMKKQRNCRSDASPVASPRPAPSWSG
jgi:hypothetical protein